MTRQSIILAFCLTLIMVPGFSKISSQQIKQRDIKDFFIPKVAQLKGKATYVGQYETPPYLRTNKYIFYLRKESHEYIVMYANIFNGNPTSAAETNIVITDDEVKMTYSELTTMVETKKQSIFKQPVTLLKLPPDNGQVTWDSKSIAGDDEQCTASFTTVKYRGIELETIKVIKTSSDTSIQTIEYYAEGLGLHSVYFYDPDTGEEKLVNEILKIVQE